MATVEERVKAVTAQVLKIDAEGIKLENSFTEDLGAESVSRINRIGRISLDEIAQALDSFGFIESQQMWLAKDKEWTVKRM